MAIAVLLSAVAGRRFAPILVGYVLVALWGAGRWRWLWRSILPTIAPFWIDRLITAVAIVVGTGGVVIAVRAVLTGRAPSVRSATEPLP